MKRFLVILICLGMLLGSVASAHAEEMQVFEMSKKVKTLVALGLVAGDADGELHLEDTFTRAEMSALVYRLQFPDMEPTASRQIFQDVGQYFWAAGYIEMLYEAGIVRGDGTENFRPNDPVTLAEADMMFLSLAGYANYITEVSGGYPTGCMATAQKAKLNREVDGNAEYKLTRNDAFTLLYNLLYIDVCKSNFDGTKYYFNGNFMNEVLELYSDKGILDGVKGTTLDGNSLRDGYVSIDGHVFEDTSDVTAELLGYRGEFYYRERQGENVLVCFLEDGNSVLKLDDEDIVSYQDNAYQYQGEKRTQSARLYKGKDIIYNGEVVNNEGNMTPRYGYVKLVDNNKDGLYDIVVINEYRNVFCTYVGIEEERIYYTVQDEQGERKESLNLASYDEYTIYNQNGDKIKLEKLLGNQVLMLQETEKNTVKITV